MNKNDPRKALGKGLHSLLPSRGPAQASAAAPQPAPEPPKPAAPREGDVQRIPIEQIKPNPNQPRREFDQAALMELALSIEKDGIIQPIIVRNAGDNQYQIIAGERRWRAAGAAGLKEVPVIAREASDEQVLELD
jgi:ParB family transcriptional regulator, chromosome partitioning protein